MKTGLDLFYRLLVGVVLLFGLLLAAGYSTHSQETNKGQTARPMRDIKDVMDANVEWLMALPGVVGVYISALQDGTPLLKVMVAKKTADLEQQIPTVLEGHPVLLIETGEIKPFSGKAN
jgi:hypothetical protein